ncbi:MAG: hypothetical protein KY476_14635 [Planctomycetes bacterium]|nr:hypothetical protein [Planctomycetota bacterium]
MPIKIECDICGAKYRVGDHRAGKSVPCKECGSAIDVPGSRRGGKDLEEQYFEDESPRPRAKRGATAKPRRPQARAAAGGSNANLWIAAGIGGVVAIGVGIMVFSAMTRKGEDAQPNQNVAQNQPNAIPDQFQPQPGQNNFQPPAGNNQVPPAGANGNAIPPANNAPPAVPPNFAAQPPQAGAPPAGNNRPSRPRPGRPSAATDFAAAAPRNIAQGDWKVTADPPPEAVTIDPAQMLKIDLPRSTDATDVFFPRGYSPYIGLGEIRDDAFMQIYDLRGKKRLGQVGGVRASVSKMDITPDGKYFAAAGNHTQGVLIWDVKASKPHKQLPLPQKHFVNLMMFGGNERMIAAQGLEFGEQIHVWKMPGGEPERSFDPPKDADTERALVSPGGKYLTMFVGENDNYHVWFYDLAAGDVASRLPTPVPKFGRPQCTDLAYSPDGKELAGIFQMGGDNELWIWDMDRGALVTQVKLDDDFRNMFVSANGPPLQWFPDQQRFLVYGKGILDRGSGKFVFKFPQDFSDRAPRRVVDAKRIGVVTGGRTGGEFTTFELSEELLAKAAEIAAAGGEAVDAALPPLKKADWSASRPVLVAGGGWSAQPEPAPQPPGELLPQPVQVAAADGKLNGFGLSDAAAARAALFYETAAARPGRPPDAGQSPARLDILSLTDGEVAHSLKLPFACNFLAMSPSGKRAVFALAKTEDRLDVWSIEDGQHVSGWRPYADEQHDHHKKITAAMFVDDEHLLTLNSQNKLALWEVATGKARYHVENAVRVLESPPGLSPGGQYVVLFGDKLAVFFDARSGENKGSLVLDGAAAAAAFDPAGQRFAVVLRGGGKSSAVVFDMQTGRPETQFPLPDRSWMGRGMHFCGSDHLLFNENDASFVLIDVPRKVVAWTYKAAPFSRHSPLSPDGRHWYLAPPRLGSKEVYLTAAALPEAGAQNVLASKELGPSFLLEPGGSIAVNLTLPQQAPGQTNFPEAVRKNIAAKYGQHNITVAAQAPLTLNVSFTERTTDKTQTYRSFGGGGEGETTVSERIFDCRAAVTHNGQPVWERNNAVSNLAFSVIRREGETIEGKLQEQQWQSATNYLLNFEPPAYVFAPGSSDGYGQSTLTAGGPVPGG